MIGRMSGHPWGDIALQKELDLVAERLSEESRKADAFVGPEIARVISGEGKMIRAALVLLSARLGSKDVPGRIELALSLELIHLATLIHDDIIDGASSRRGIPSLHKSLGVTKAVLAGDWLLARALSVAGGNYSPSLFAFLADRIGELCSSEIRQDGSYGVFSIGRDEYLERIDGKTAALIRLACRAGADASGAELAVLDTLDAWALTVGRGFQMEDDALDYEGRPGKLGKAIRVDLNAGLATLPLILALETGDERLKKMVSRVKRSGSLRNRRIHKRVLRLGGAQKAREEAGAAYAEALKLSQSLPGSGSDDFANIVNRLQGRTV